MSSLESDYLGVLNFCFTSLKKRHVYLSVMRIIRMRGAQYDDQR